MKATGYPLVTRMCQPNLNYRGKRKALIPQNLFLTATAKNKFGGHVEIRLTFSVRVLCVTIAN